MANVKITDMTPGTTPLDGTELLEAVQSGGTVSVTSLDIVSLRDAYGTFCDTTDQSGSTSAATAVKFGTNLISGHDISVVTDGSALTRVTVTDAGTYNFGINLQFKNTDAAAHNVTIWLQKNGTNVAYSATTITVPKTGDGGLHVFHINWFETLTAGQYIQVQWLPTSTNVTIDATAAAAGPPAIPDIPSSYISVERIA